MLKLLLKTYAGNGINTPWEPLARTWNNVNLITHTLVALSKGKQNGKRIELISVLPFQHTDNNWDYTPNVVIMYFIGLALIAAAVITSSINYVLH